MSSLEHGRYAIINNAQHLLKHTVSDLSYVNPDFPTISTIGGAIDYILNSLYPNPKPAVADVASLPPAGNTIGDFRIVEDDGDGKMAAYRWLQLEGEVAASWQKVYDIDWGAGSVLSSFYNITQDQFVVRNGSQTRDATGAIIVGLYAGQHVYGGTTAGENLTLFANSGDGTGARTGYVQVDDNFRPSINETFTNGLATFRWLKTFAKSAEIGYLTIADGVLKTLITSTQPEIDFAALNLTTTGEIKSTTAKVITSVEVGTYLGDALVLAPGSITDESGAISFGNENLSTTGNITGAVGYYTTQVQVGPLLGDALLLGAGSITDESGAISFDNENLTTTGNFTGNNLYATTSIEVGPLLGDALVLAAGSITDQSGAISFGNENLSTTGTFSATSTSGGNLQLSGNTLASTNVDGDIVIDPNGTGIISFASAIQPSSDNALDLGDGTHRVRSVYIGAGISNGTNSITAADLLTFRDAPYRDAARTLPAQVGDGLFWNGTQWLASVADTEVKHELISGLHSGAAVPSTNPDAGHPQFSLLAGRSGGQSIQGGTAASENLTFESTSHATKGFVSTKDNFVANTNATYGGGVWSGIDLGDATHMFRDIHSRGEFNGFRFENVGANPAFDAQTPGRAWFNTASGKVVLNTGTAVIEVGAATPVQETPSGTVNGSNQTFTLANTPTSNAAVLLWVDSVIQIQGTDYTIVGATITMTVAPATGQGLYAFYTK